MVKAPNDAKAIAGEVAKAPSSAKHVKHVKKVAAKQSKPVKMLAPKVKHAAMEQKSRLVKRTKKRVV